LRIICFTPFSPICCRTKPRNADNSLPSEKVKVFLNRCRGKQERKTGKLRSAALNRLGDGLIAIGESGGLFEPLELAPKFVLANAERDGEKYAVSLGAAALKELRRLQRPCLPAMLEASSTR
jgi:hypothetical protein